MTVDFVDRVVLAMAMMALGAAGTLAALGRLEAAAVMLLVMAALFSANGISEGAAHDVLQVEPPGDGDDG